MAYDIVVGRDAADKKAFGDRGLVYIGKGYVKMGQYTSLSNKIFMDIARSHVVLVAGKRGSGKSYTLGVIAEELSALPKGVRENIGSLIFDTMGIYWTMKFKNEKDKDLLQEWDLKQKNLPVKIFVPFGHYDEYVENGEFCTYLPNGKYIVTTVVTEHEVNGLGLILAPLDITVSKYNIIIIITLRVIDFS